ncbi:hypothetical protein, partial [Enterococcus faecium]|uniref:hypothetical protein n=1 Tax=Enterococcus faecium TaxID=1352 RepID=UPI0019D427BF
AICSRPTFIIKAVSTFLSLFLFTISLTFGTKTEDKDVDSIKNMFFTCKATAKVATSFAPLTIPKTKFGPLLFIKSTI